MAASPEAPPEAADYLDRQVLVPGLLGIFLIVGAGLLWAGTHGEVGGYLALFWGGILALVLGVALVAVVAVLPLGVVSVGGVVWLVLERAALTVGSPFGWAAPVLGVVGVLLLPGPVRRLRTAAEERRAWSELKGGSVPP